MTSGSPDAMFERWRQILLGALNSPGAVMAWQDRRYQIAHRLGRLLTEPGPDSAAVTGPALYGIYVAGGGLLYVGQTQKADRRLRDLPVGESHHVATTVPPEVWERIIVVQWPSLLAGIPPAEAARMRQLGELVCGLALEHNLQMSYQPIMTARRRVTNGGWRPRDLAASKSVGAMHARELPELFARTRATWDALSQAAAPPSGRPVHYAESGRAVFPAVVIGGERASDRRRRACLVQEGDRLG
jgi:hypothetical protein